MRSDARKKLTDPQPHWDAGVNEIIRRERAAALDEARATILQDADLREYIIRWLYNGPFGHQGPPPPNEARVNLEVDAANAVEAIAAWLEVTP